MSEALAPAVIPFHGNELVTTEVNNIPHVAMRPLVEAIGLNWPSQYTKLIADSAKWGVAMIATPSAGGAQNTLCIPLRKLNGWLFSIDADRVAPELRDTIVMYQEECFEVLYEYWHGGRQVAAVQAQTFCPDLQNRVFYRGMPVLASSSLALLFGTDAKTLSNLKRDTRGLFREGVHHFDLKGVEVEQFKSEAATVPLCILPAQLTGCQGVTLFTQEGAKYLALYLGKSAMDIYLHLERVYYAPAKSVFAKPAKSIEESLLLARAMLENLTAANGSMERVAGILKA